MGEREALARLIDPGAWQGGAFFTKQSTLKAADRILAAGWRPPPEPQAADVTPCLSGLATAEPCMADEKDLRRCRLCGFIVDLRYAAEKPDALPVGSRRPEPQPAASEVVAQAQRFINSFSHLAKPPQPTMSFAREVVAQHARAEAAERERDLYKASASHHAERADDNSADCARLVSEKMDQYEARLAAEAAVKRLTEAGAELHRAVMADMRGLIDPGEALAQDRRNRLWKAEAAWRAALAPGGGDGR